MIDSFAARRSSTGAIRILLTPLLFLCLFSGCSGAAEIGATEVLNESNCKGSSSGLKEVTYAEVAALRGSTLLGITTAPTATGPELLLLSLSKGQQPTAGYRFELRDALLEEGTATLVVHWQTPAPDATLAQIITYPCLVVGLETGPFDTIRAVDQHDQLLGEVKI